MRLYSVHAPPDESWGGVPPDPERVLFVKDGIAWPAFFMPPLWMLWHRLWLPLVWAVAFVLALMWIDRLAGDGAAVLTALAGLVFLAVAGNDLRRHALASRGWTEIGSSHGRNVEEAEIRFFVRDDSRAAANTAIEPPVDRSGRQSDAEHVIGVFPEPERE
jgi:hypothetical protein